MFGSPYGQCPAKDRITPVNITMSAANCDRAGGYRWQARRGAGGQDRRHYPSGNVQCGFDLCRASGDVSRPNGFVLATPGLCNGTRYIAYWVMFMKQCSGIGGIPDKQVNVFLQGIHTNRN
jgi:hypothetical protein